MNLNTFINQNNIQPGDAIIVKKDGIGLLDHYLIYLGNHWGEHKFIANYFKGTEILTYSALFEFSKRYSPSRIRRFKGTDVQREAAIQRALNRCDQNSYHLILNNCEHYANCVQEGKSYSQQTAIFGSSIVVTGLAVTAASKSDAGKGVGLAMTLLGLLTLVIDSNNNN